MLPSGDRKDLVQFLERQSLRLRQTEVAEDPAEQVPTRIPGKRPLRLEGVPQRQPGQGNNEVEAPSGGCGKRHSNVADIQRLVQISALLISLQETGKTYEGFRRIGEWHRSFARRIHNHEEVYTRCNTGSPAVLVGDPKGEAREEQEKTHQGKGRQEQIPPAERVNRVNSGKGKDPIGYAAACEVGQDPKYVYGDSSKAHPMK